MSFLVSLSIFLFGYFLAWLLFNADSLNSTILVSASFVRHNIEHHFIRLIHGL